MQIQGKGSPLGLPLQLYHQPGREASNAVKGGLS